MGGRAVRGIAVEESQSEQWHPYTLGFMGSVYFEQSSQNVRIDLFILSLCGTNASRRWVTCRLDGKKTSSVRARFFYFAQSWFVIHAGIVLPAAEWPIPTC